MANWCIILLWVASNEGSEFVLGTQEFQFFSKALLFFIGVMWNTNSETELSKFIVRAIVWLVKIFECR